MNKLGRLRKDTLRDIAIQRNKQKEIKTRGKVFQKHGNKVLIMSDYDGTCCLCGSGYVIGNFIWYDSTKSVGRKAVHRDCYQPNG